LPKFGSMEYMNEVMKRETLMLNSEQVLCSKDIARQARSKQGLCHEKTEAPWKLSQDTSKLRFNHEMAGDP
jgi:hypothetical protein